MDLKKVDKQISRAFCDIKAAKVVAMLSAGALALCIDGFLILQFTAAMGSSISLYLVHGFIDISIPWSDLPAWSAIIFYIATICFFSMLIALMLQQFATVRYRKYALLKRELEDGLGEEIVKL